MTTQTQKEKKPPKKKKEKEPHVLWIPPSTFACLHCGDNYEMALPAPIDMLTGAMATFSKTHKPHKLGPRGRACGHCFDFGHAEANCWRKQYRGSWRNWAVGPDTGISSAAICRRLKPLGENGIIPYGDSRSAFGNHPHDPADFGRCHRLLHAIPGWRARIGEMNAESAIWAKLADNWDELEKLYLEELPGPYAHKLYARMRELIE
jgi:hypothetical protein